MQVKIFRDKCMSNLEEKINFFIENKKVKDIKFSSYYSGYSDISECEAMVIYEEKEDNK